jgi:hypothetical protein
MCISSAQLPWSPERAWTPQRAWTLTSRPKPAAPSRGGKSTHRPPRASLRHSPTRRNHTDPHVPWDRNARCANPLSPTSRTWPAKRGPRHPPGHLTRRSRCVATRVRAPTPSPPSHVSWDRNAQFAPHPPPPAPAPPGSPPKPARAPAAPRASPPAQTQSPAATAPAGPPPRAPPAAPHPGLASPDEPPCQPASQPSPARRPPADRPRHRFSRSMALDPRFSKPPPEPAAPAPPTPRDQASTAPPSPPAGNPATALPRRTADPAPPVC